MSPNHAPETVDPGPGTGLPGRWLVVLCAVTLFSVPIVQHVTELREPDTGGFRLPQCYDVFEFVPPVKELAGIRGLRDALDLLPSVPELRDYEQALERQSTVAAMVRPHVHAWLASVLRVGTERAWIGRDDWLFFAPGVTHLTAPGFLEARALTRRERSVAPWNAPAHPNPLTAIIDFRDQLAARGIDLVLMPVPSKAALHPEQWSARYTEEDGPLYSPSFDKFRRRLDAASVHLYDPSHDLWETRRKYGSAYLDTDSHWTPEGARAAAHGLARFLREELDPGNPSRPFEITAAVNVQNVGDVAVMLGLPSTLQESLRESVTIHPVSDSQGRKWRPDPQADVLVLGDSYSNIYSQGDLGWGEGAGFVEQLSVELGRPIDAIRMNAGGALSVRRALADAIARGNDRLAGKKMVIYEFAMHQLSWGDWKSIDLGTVAPASKIEEGSAVGGADAVVVTGRITAVSGIPEPGSTPYRDCIISVRLDEIRTEGPEFGNSTLMAYMWGLLDNRPTDATNFRPGQRVRLSLTPWTRVEDRLGSHQRIELDDPEIRRLVPYWAEPEGSTQTSPLAEPLEPSPARTTGTDSDPFRAGLIDRATDAEGRGETVVKGRDGWLYLVGEFLHLGMGRFTEQGPAGGSDPADAIVDFHQQLERAGIELLFVPVPAKAIIYPDEALPGWEGPNLASGARLDPYHQAFYSVLRSQGVTVIDLVQDFRDARRAGGDLLFCRRDSHWSGTASRIVAERIVDVIRSRSWVQEERQVEMTTERRTVEIYGDLARNLADPAFGTEEMELDFVQRQATDPPEPIRPTESSPFLVLADSHGLIFHAGGDMHATGAGLPDHLALELGFPVDLIAVRGSGANAPRMTLARNPNRLRGKRCVLWIVNAPSLTRTIGGWQKIQVVP